VLLLCVLSIRGCSKGEEAEAAAVVVAVGVAGVVSPPTQTSTADLCTKPTLPVPPSSLPVTAKVPVMTRTLNRVPGVTARRTTTCSREGEAGAGAEAEVGAVGQGQSRRRGVALCRLRCPKGVFGACLCPSTHHHSDPRPGSTSATAS
jgi:hypothetical protein